MSDAPKDLTPLEAEVQKYKARWGLYKVVWGTVFVGILTVLITGAVEILNRSHQAETDFRRQVVESERSNISNYVEVALASDINTRIRLAHYFCNLSSYADPLLGHVDIGMVSPIWDLPEPRDACIDGHNPWTRYYYDLVRRQQSLREQYINSYMELMRMNGVSATSIELQVRAIEIDWIEQEIGRVLNGSPSNDQQWREPTNQAEQ